MEGGGGSARGKKSPKSSSYDAATENIVFFIPARLPSEGKGRKKSGVGRCRRRRRRRREGGNRFSPLAPFLQLQECRFRLSDEFLLRRRRRRSFSSSSILRRRFRKLWRRSFADNTKKKKNWKKKKRKTTSTFSSDPVFGSIKIRSSNRKDFGREIFCL